MWTALLINFKSLLYTFFILPYRGLWGYAKTFWGWRKQKRLRFDMYFFTIIVLCSIALTLTSDISSIYHWIKGKAFIKLLTLYVILDMSDILCRSVGRDLIYSLSRDVYYKKNCFKVATLLWIYTLVHSYILLIQILTLNSVIKSSEDTFLLFLLSNNFTEIKIYVFKKTDALKLYDIGTRDVWERLQQYINIGYILFSNYINMWTLQVIWTFLITEVWVDNIKAFFFNNDNGHDPSVYLSHQYLTCRIFNNCYRKRELNEAPDHEVLEKEPEKEDILQDLHIDPHPSHSTTVKVFVDQYNRTKDTLWKDKAKEMMLFRYTLNEFYSVSVFQNFMILPHCCLLIRLFESVMQEKGFLADEIFIIVLMVGVVGSLLDFLVGVWVKSVTRKKETPTYHV